MTSVVFETKMNTDLFANDLQEKKTKQPRTLLYKQIEDISKDAEERTENV